MNPDLSAPLTHEDRRLDSAKADFATKFRDETKRVIWSRATMEPMSHRVENLMDRTTHCPKCGKRLVPVVTISGRTDLQCISCDDPAVKWAESPVTAPEKPIVGERV